MELQVCLRGSAPDPGLLPQTPGKRLRVSWHSDFLKLFNVKNLKYKKKYKILKPEKTQKNLKKPKKPKKTPKKTQKNLKKNTITPS